MKNFINRIHTYVISVFDPTITYLMLFLVVILLLVIVNLHITILISRKITNFVGVMN